MQRYRFVSRPDLIGAGIVVVIGIFLMIKSPEYKLHTGAVIGPGFVPFWFGVAMVVFGVATVVGAFMRARRLAVPEPEPVTTSGSAEAVAAEPDENSLPDGDGRPEESGSRGSRWRQTAIVFGLAIVAVALTPILGIVVAFGLVAFIMLRFVERERWWIALIVTVGVMTALYLLFARFLLIPIPIGPWGF